MSVLSFPPPGRTTVRIVSHPPHSPETLQAYLATTPSADCLWELVTDLEDAGLAWFVDSVTVTHRCGCRTGQIVLLHLPSDEIWELYNVPLRIPDTRAAGPVWLFAACPGHPLLWEHRQIGEQANRNA